MFYLPLSTTIKQIRNIINTFLRSLVVANFVLNHAFYWNPKRLNMTFKYWHLNIVIVVHQCFKKCWIIKSNWCNTGQNETVGHNETVVLLWVSESTCTRDSGIYIASREYEAILLKYWQEKWQKDALMWMKRISFMCDLLLFGSRSFFMSLEIY